MCEWLIFLLGGGTTDFNVFLFSGAQVGVATFAVNFMANQGIGIDHSRASELFSYCQMTFTAGRYTYNELVYSLEAANLYWPLDSLA